MSQNKKSRLILCAVTFMFWFSQYAYVPYFMPKLALIGALPTLVGAVSAVYGLSQLILRIPMGVAADKVGNQKLFVILGMIISTLAAGGLATANGVGAMILFRMLSGVAASMWASFTVLYTSYYELSQTIKAIAFLNVFNFLGRFFSSFLGGSVVNAFGSMNSAFMLSAVAAGIGILFSLFLFDGGVRGKKLVIRELLSFKGEKMLLYTSVLAVLCQTITFSTGYGFVSDYALTLGADKASLGTLAAVFILPSTVGSYLTGSKLLRRFQYSSILCAGFIFLAVYCVALSVAPSVGFLYIAQLIGGCGNGLLFSLLMALSGIYIDVSKKTAAMGFYQALYALGMTIGPLLMGMLVDSIGFKNGFICICAISVFSAVLAKVLIDRAVKFQGQKSA